jgi:hypothetical protein
MLKSSSLCLYSSNLGTFWLKIEQFWPFEEISIFSSGSHLGYRTVLTDISLKRDHLSKDLYNTNMSHYNLCGIGSQHSNISKGKREGHIFNITFLLLSTLIGVLHTSDFYVYPPFFLLKYYCVVIQYHTNCNNSYLCYINPCFW